MMLPCQTIVCINVNVLQMLLSWYIKVCIKMRILHSQNHFVNFNYSCKQCGCCIHFVILPFEIIIYKNNESIKFYKLF
jgi:hypothetical protein